MTDQSKEYESNDEQKFNFSRSQRARVKSCMNALKKIIVDANKKELPRDRRIDKADILEMTLKHLLDLTSKNAYSSDRFEAGYNCCLEEVASCPGLEPYFKYRFLKHLENRAHCRGIATPSYLASAVLPINPSPSITLPETDIIPMNLVTAKMSSDYESYLECENFQELNKACCMPLEDVKADCLSDQETIDPVGIDDEEADVYIKSPSEPCPSNIWRAW